MKVILLKDTLHVGRRGQIIEVSDGYGRNFLIKSGKAKLATLDTVSEVQKRMVKEGAALGATEKELSNAIKQLQGKTFLIHVKASETGGLYSGIGKTQIADVLRKEGFPIMSEEYLVLDAPLKHIGEHSVGLEIGKQKAEIIISIIPQV